MVNMSWGLLGPEKLDKSRRTRTLGLGAAVREFNDLAVPGLGGIWFGKQLFLAVLGVAVAEKVRENKGSVTNITVANAIEALACWLALRKKEKDGDLKFNSRLRGKTKMQGKNDLAFAKVSQRSFYVTQPMRMATVQPLLALGFVSSDSQRFSRYSCSEQGYEFIEAVCSDSNPCFRSKNVLDYLTQWANNQNVNVTSVTKLQEALSPLVPLNKSARYLLYNQLVKGHSNSNEAKRRRDALNWVENLRLTSPNFMNWKNKPEALSNEHWKDLRAGAKFFLARRAAIKLLDLIESQMANLSKPQISLNTALSTLLIEDVQKLKECCQDFLKENHDPTQLASEFCRECSNADPTIILERLIRRDNRVLCLRNQLIVPGPAYRGNIDDSINVENDSPDVAEIPWPDGISERIKNLFELNRDLKETE
jgi:hypothetical protein